LLGLAQAIVDSPTVFRDGRIPETASLFFVRTLPTASEVHLEALPINTIPNAEKGNVFVGCAHVVDFVLSSQYSWLLAKV